MLSFKVKKIYLFGSTSKQEFEDWWDEHQIVTPRSISEYHFSPAASYQQNLDGAVFVYNGELTREDQLDVKWCYRNGVPLVVWNKGASDPTPWLRWHTLGVFARQDQAVKVLLTALGLFEQA